MKTKTNLKLIFMALAVMALSSSCSDDDNSVTNDDDDFGQITFTVNGEEKTFDASAEHIISETEDPDATLISHENADRSLQIVLTASPGDIGAYDVADDSNDNIGVAISYSDENGTFVNTATSDGQINVTEYTNSSLSGNFNATLKNNLVSGEELSITNGSFTDLPVTSVSGNPEQF